MNTKKKNTGNKQKKNSKKNIFSWMFDPQYRGILPVFLIGVLGAVIYSNTFNSPFHFDDNFYIVNNFAIRSPHAPLAIWKLNSSRFIPLVTFALNYHIGKLEVFGYHAFNLIIHIMTSVMAYVLMRLTFKTPLLRTDKYFDKSVFISFLTALIFLAHPVQTESVTYICQRITLLAGMFYLAAIALYLKGRLSQGAGEQPRVYSMYYFFAVLAAGICSLTKEITLTLPMIIVFYELIFFQKAAKKNNIALLAGASVGVFFVAVKMLDIDIHNIGEIFIKGRSVNVSTGHYFLTQMRVIVTYIRLLFFPLNQNIDYDYPLITTALSLRFLLSAVFLSGIAAFAVYMVKRNRLISLGIFWFFLLIAPQSSLLAAPDIIFEHRLYIAVIGYGICLSVLLSNIFARKGKKTLIIAAVSVVAIYSFLSYSRNFVWRDDYILWDDAVKKSPKKPRAYYNRALSLAGKGEHLRAIDDYNTVIGLNPKIELAYIGRGKSYLAIGDLKRSMSDFNKAIEINTNEEGKPDNMIMELAYYNRALVHLEEGDLDNALRDLEYITGVLYLKLHKKTNPYKLRARIFKEQDRFDDAIEEYAKVIDLDPGDHEAYVNRGNLYMLLNQPRKAISDYNIAEKIAPRYGLIYKNRAVAYFLLKNYRESWKDVNKAVFFGVKPAPGFVKSLEREFKRQR